MFCSLAFLSWIWCLRSHRFFLFTSIFWNLCIACRTGTIESHFNIRVHTIIILRLTSRWRYCRWIVTFSGKIITQFIRWCSLIFRKWKLTHITCWIRILDRLPWPSYASSCRVFYPCLACYIIHRFFCLSGPIDLFDYSLSWLGLEVINIETNVLLLLKIC